MDDSSLPGIRFCPLCASRLEIRFAGGRQRPVCPEAGCGFVAWDNPTPVVAALVEHEGKVVLARGRGWPRGRFGLVTGFLERGETVEQAVLREVGEELGLQGEIEATIGVYTFERRNQLIVAFHVRAEGPISLGDELEEIRHIRPEDLRPWPFGTGLAVEDWLARRRGGDF
jgi:NADH pyrophosphatase NudC (nudix superfamily)